VETEGVAIYLEHMFRFNHSTYKALNLKIMSLRPLFDKAVALS
jgi:hypothetical protein